MLNTQECVYNILSIKVQCQLTDVGLTDDQLTDDQLTDDQLTDDQLTDLFVFVLIDRPYIMD